MSSGSSWRNLYTGYETGLMYGSHITMRPPGASTRTASSKNFRGDGTWWSTSNSTSAPTLPASNGSASALASPSCHGARTRSVSSMPGMNSRAKPGPDPSSIRRPSDAGGSSLASRA